MQCGVACQPGLLSCWRKCSWKLQEPLLTHNEGNRDRRCSLIATFRRLRGGEESIAFVSYTNCTMAKGHGPSLNGLFQQPFKQEQKQSFGHPTRFAFHLQHPVNIYYLFSVFLLVSGTIFWPLPYLRVTVFRLSGLSFRRLFLRSR